MRVLIVEDDNQLAANMRLMLAGENWIVHRCSTGDEAISLIRHMSLDVALLDLGLPDMSGLKVLAALPVKLRKTPIICVSGLIEVEMRVAALRAGASDYIVKPFHRDELLARIHAVVRRFHGRTENSVRIGAWIVHLFERALTHQGVEVALTRLERIFLMRLAQTPRVVVTGEQLYAHAYEEGDEPDAHMISVVISNLRTKLRKVSGGDPLIQNVWGRGYMLSINARLYGTSPANGREWLDGLDFEHAASAEA